jgi:hypothetical protein
VPEKVIEKTGFFLPQNDRNFCYFLQKSTIKKTDNLIQLGKMIKKILIILSLSFLAILAFFIVDVWNTVNQKPNIEFGHLILRDRTGIVMTDK